MEFGSVYLSVFTAMGVHHQGKWFLLVTLWGLCLKMKDWFDARLPLISFPPPSPFSTPSRFMGMDIHHQGKWFPCYALRLAPRMKLSRGMMLSSGWPFSLFSTPDRPEGYPPSRQVILPIYNLRPGPVMRFSIEMMLSSGWLFAFHDTQCDVRSQTNRDSRQFAAARDGGFSLPLRVPDTMAMCINYWDKWFWPVMRAPRYSCQLPSTLFAFQNPHPRPWSWQSAVIIKTSIAGWWLGVRLTWGVCRPGRSNCPGSWYQNEEKERERERERKAVRLSSTARRSAFKIQRVTRYILGVCLLIRKP